MSPAVQSPAAPLFLLTRDTSTFVHVIGYVPYYIQRDGGAVTDDKAGKPVTAVHNCVSIYVILNPLNIPGPGTFNNFYYF